MILQQVIYILTPILDSTIFQLFLGIPLTVVLAKLLNRKRCPRCNRWMYIHHYDLGPFYHCKCGYMIEAFGNESR